jgi:parallel beta-helix repeat protein
MRMVLMQFLWFVSILASATDFYVSSSGNDKNSGTSPLKPWATISKVNSIFPSLKPGDRILFKRGDMFVGTLRISASGLPDSPITIGAFGTGKNPVITGFTILKGWTNEGNGIYSKAIDSESVSSLVIIDSIPYGMGRYPNYSYLIYESHKANSSITDNELTDSPDWTGAEVVINIQNWLLIRYIITNHHGNTIEYKNPESDDIPKNNRGYFIQNDLRTLDIYGEWYINKAERKFYMYFGKSNPDSKTVKIASLNNLIYNYVKNNITIDGISFEGSIEDAVCIAWADNCVIKNCSVKYAGQSGLDIRGKNNEICNNVISWCYKAGIYVEGANSQITGNSIQNIGLIPGAAVKGNISEGIFVGGENSLIQFNSVNNVGRMGIRVGSGWMTRIKNNFVNNFLMVLNDGGGIYLDGSLEETRIVEGNLILNGRGNSVGGDPAACGIYLDEYSCNVIVRDNTVAYNPYGINLHKANSNTIVNNLSFGNKVQIALHNTDFLPTIHGNKISNNVFFSMEASSLAVFFNSKTDDIPHFGAADNNFYAWPSGNDKIFYTFSPFTGKRYRTLSGWQSFTREDANSNKYTFTATDAANIHFYYNASAIPRIIPLTRPMTDIKGIKYVKSVTLSPYSSVVLMADPNHQVQIVPGLK